MRLLNLLLRIIKSPLKIFVLIRGIKDAFKEFTIYNILIMLNIFSFGIISLSGKLRVLPFFPVSKFQSAFLRHITKITRLIDRKTDQISRTDLIQLSIKNMLVKKTRTLVTIGGVSIGIGAIVFLVSIGYGLQNVVISRVARLDELKQAEITPQAGSKVKIDDKIISDIKEFTNVADVLPVIAAVGRVNYKNSVTDMAVYGVTTGYLEKSAIKPVKGKIFLSNDLSIKVKNVDINSQGEVAGASTKTSFIMGESLGQAEVEIDDNKWIRVRSTPSTTGSVLGYTRKIKGTQFGEAIIGESYESDTKTGTYVENEQGEDLGLWVKSSVALWQEQECDDKEVSCVDGKYLEVKDASGEQMVREGYMAVVNMTADVSNSISVGTVLGTSSSILEGEILAAESSPSANTVIIDEGDWVRIVDPNASKTDTNVKKVPLHSSAIKQAVVNRAAIKVLNIDENLAIGKRFKTSFIIPTSLVADSKQRIESVDVEYEIVGVVPDDSTPLFYVALIDLRSLGTSSFSQVKVVVDETEQLTEVRKKIDAIGFSSRSVADTVEQISSLFSTLRIVLGIMGMVALIVASLGMFNTLTVSLLERSREVGLMKALGMTTAEVQQLFLTESVIMGTGAGIFGLLVGYLLGKLLSLVLSTMAVFKGEGFLDISHIPFTFVVTIMILSTIVGIFTGIFPARRSKKISALDALRYE
jgi:ABC-type antimicrobial peptide transport system permease subunit